MRIDLSDLNEVTSETRRYQAAQSDVRAGARGRLIGDADFRELLGHLYDAAFITDFTGRIVSANERGVEFVNCSIDRLLELSMIDIISGATPKLIQTVLETLQSERFVLIQAVCLQDSGGGFPCEITVNMLHLSDAAYLCFFMRNTSVRVEQELRLRSRSNALQNAGSGIGVCDLEGNISYSNRALLSMLGCDEGADAVGTSLWEYLIGEETADAVVRAVANGNTWAGELRLRRWDGSTIFVQASIAPNVSNEDELHGMVFSLIDVTEQRNAQIQLMRQHERVQEDLNLAREFQLAIMRKSYPVFPKNAAPGQSALRFAHVYLPCGAVGGDSFDVWRISDTQAGIFVYDVMGHGVRSALIVATVHGLIQELGAQSLDPASLLTALNHDLAATFRESGQDAFVTALYVVVNTATRQATIASAGHPRPILVRRRQNTVKKVILKPGIRGPALGLFNDTTYASEEHDFTEGDILALYTDGISEARRHDGCAFESSGVENALRQRIHEPLSDLLDGVLADASAFCGSDTFIDDICLFGIEFSEPSEP